MNAHATAEPAQAEVLPPAQSALATVEAPQPPAAPSSRGGSDQSAILAMIERAVSDPAFDVGKLERLWAMHKEAKRLDAESDFNDALARVQEKMRPVAKNKHNDQTKSDYANLAAVCDAITPIYSAAGFSLSFGEEDSPKEGHLRIGCVLARGAFSRAYRADVPIDGAGMQGNKNKTATHAYGSTSSYGRRYLTLSIFNIATKDDDGNAAGKKAREPITDEQVAEVKALAAETSTPVEKVLETYKRDAVEDMTAADYRDALGVFRKIKARMAKETEAHKAPARGAKQQQQRGGEGEW